MSRTTKKHVESALAVYASACKAANLIPEGMHLILQEGSQTNGRAWRVYLTGDRVEIPEHPFYAYPKGSGCSRPPCGDDYLGWSAEEARRTLQDRAAGMWAILQAPSFAGRVTL